MDFKKIATAVGALAPTLASFVGGPAGGAAVSALEKVFGFNPGAATDDDLSTAIVGATAEQQIALKKLDLDYKLAVQQAAYSDTASARNMAVQTKDSTPKIIAYLVVAMTCIGEGWLLIHGAVPGIDQALLGRIMGTLDSALMLVLGYYFGATHSNNK